MNKSEELSRAEEKWKEIHASLERVCHFKTIKYNAKATITQVIERSSEMFVDDSLDSLNKQRNIWGKTFQELSSFYSVFNIKDQLDFFSNVFFNKEKAKGSKEIITITAFIDSLRAFEDNFVLKDNKYDIPDISSIAFYFGSLNKYLNNLAKLNEYPDLRYHTAILNTFINEVGQFVRIHQDVIDMNQLFYEHQNSCFVSKLSEYSDYSVEKFGELFDLFVQENPSAEEQLRRKIRSSHGAFVLEEWDYRKMEKGK